MVSDVLLLLLSLLVPVLLVCVLVLYRAHRARLCKLEFLFNGLENRDYTFRFPQRSRDRAFDTALNRIKDVLAQHHTETLQREKYYEQLLSVVSTAILVVDRKGRVLRTNAAAHRMLDREFITHISQVEQALQADRFSVRRTEVSLDEKTVELWAVSDISHELSQKELASWEKVIRVLTHEMMNGISPVATLSQTLLERITAGEPLPAVDLEQALHTIHSTSDHLLRFVRDYRRLTLLPTPVPRPFYVKLFLEKMMAQARGFDGATAVQMELHVQPTDLMLYADESLLTHVCTNLLKNAVEALATTPDARILLCASLAPDESVRILVSNNGPAIPAEVSDHMFIPFFTTKPGGSGIGLSLSARIMQASGGQLRLLEEGDGLTTFQLTFPA